MWFGLSLICATASANTNPPDAIIEDALVVDIPPDGFDRIVNIIPELVPLEIPVEALSEDIERGGSCVNDIWFDIANLNIGIEVVDASIVPQDGYLDFNVSLDVNVNDALNPFLLDYMLSLCIEYNCQGYVDPFQVDITSQIYLNIDDLNLDGVNDLDASFENFAYSYDLASEDINVENCALAVFENVLNWFGLSIFDLIISIVEPIIEETVSDLVPTLEETIEDAFNQFSIDQTVDLMGTPLNLYLAPEEILIKSEGLRVLLDGAANTDSSADCINAYDPNGSLATASTLRPIGYAPNGVSGDVLATVDDDFLNQVLYHAWRSGILCQTIDASTFPIDTGILNLLTGDAFVELFPDTQALIIETAPVNPLLLNMATQSDVAVDVDELGLNFFAEVDGRQTRVLSLGITTDVGVDVPFNAQTGDLAIELDLSGERVTPSLPYNEFLPDSADLIETSFVEQFDTILGLIDIESLLGDLAFTLPSFNGVGLNALEIAPTGQNNQDLGAFVGVGSVPYSGGCASEDDSTGCEGGCSSQNSGTPRVALLISLLFFGLIRRRATE